MTNDLAGRVLAVVDARAQVKDCTRCSLHSHCRQPVPGTFTFHNTNRVLVVGEAPGRHEDEAGVPFIGKSGSLIRGWLGDTGINPMDTSYVNVVSCWPGRTPTPEEVSACRPNLDKQIAAAQPEYVLVLGGVALQALIPWPTRVSELHGLWWKMKIGGESGSGRYAWATATYHPSAALRNQELAVAAFHDVETFSVIVKEELPGLENSWCGRCRRADVEVVWGETLGFCKGCAGMLGVPA